MSSFLSIGDITIHPIIEQEGPFLPALTCSPLSAELLDENRHWLAAKARDRSTGSADRLGDHAGGCRARRRDRAGADEPAAYHRCRASRDSG